MSGYNGATINSTSQLITGLSAGSIYYYRVRSLNANGVASTNSEVAGVITTAAIPTANQPLYVTFNSFKAAWTAVSGATSYELQVSTNPQFSPKTTYSNLTTTSLNFGSALSNTTYYYRVKAIYPTGPSGFSNVRQFNTLDHNYALQVPTLSASAGVETISLSWTSVPSTNFYLLDVAYNNTFTDLVADYQNYTASGLAWIVYNLTPGTTYYCRVRSLTISGQVSEYSNVITVTPDNPLGVPDALPVTTATSSSFVASWSPVSGATGYRLDVSTGSGFSTFVTGYNNLSVSGTTTSVGGLSPATNYYFRVRAVVSGVSANSNTITTQTPYATQTSAPSCTFVTSTSFQMSWPAVVGATSYRIDIAADAMFTSILANYNNVGITTPSFNVTGFLLALHILHVYDQ